MAKSYIIPLPLRRKLRKTVLQLKEEDDANKPNCDVVGLDDFVKNRKRVKKQHVFWLFLITFCSCFLTYQIYDRVSHYFNYPTAVDVSSKPEKIIVPALIICGCNTKAMARLWNRTYVKLDTEINEMTDRTDFKCVNMFKHLMAMPSYDMNELWEATNITKEIVDIEIKGFSNGMVTQTMSNSLMGICATFEFSEASSKLLVGKSFTVSLEKLYYYICPSTMYTVELTFFKNFGKSMYRTGKYPGSTAKITFSYNKYVFLNSPKNPCSTAEEYRECYRKCLSKILEEKLTCKFPFNSKEINLPLCKCANDTDQQYAITHKLISTVNPTSYCSCPRQCEDLGFLPTFHPGTAKDEKTVSVSMEFTEENVHLYKERYTYDIIALLSDLGGNLGLFLGLSLISLTETGCYFYFTITRAPQPPSKAKTIRQDKKIRHLYDVCKKRVILTETKITNSTKRILLNLKIILVIIIVGLSIYLSYKRLKLYYEEPVTRIVTVVGREYTAFPSITICGERPNENLGNRKLYLSEKTGEICDYISPWRLFDLKSKLTLKVIWKSLDISGSLLLNEDLARHATGYSTTLNITNKVVALPLGSCSQITVDITDDLSAYLLVQYQYLFRSEVCPYPHVWYFVSDPEDQVNFLYPIALGYGSYNTIDMQISKFSRINTKHNPCEEKKKEYFACKNSCLQNNLFRKLNCSLPFMPSNHLQPCNTADDTIKSYSTYFKTYESNLRNCKCKKPCQEISYNPLLYVDALPIDFFTLINHKAASDFEEVIKETLRYPLSQLLSEVGSILGIAMGLSLLSLYDYVLKSYNWLKPY